MSEDCGDHGLGKKVKLLRICGGIFVVLIILTVVLIWAILWPTKPRFILHDVTVFVFNISSPYLLTTNFQITIAARNPNYKAGIFYDRLHVYASYMNQQITFPTAIPPTYQGQREENAWSPFVYGTSIPIAPNSGVALYGEQSRGLVALMIRADGHMRWKVGPVITGRYHLHVHCPAYVNLWSKAAGTAVGENAVKYTLLTKCSVDV